MIKLGEKIKILRRKKNISQEILANYLGVSFQAVSKWETEVAMPDVAMIPAIASFFGVSIDELFDFNVYAVEKNVAAIVDEHSKYWDTDKARSEQILRDGLKQYPGNDILLNCLIGVIPVPQRSSEVIDLCKTLIEGTHSDEVKYDAYRILAEAYQASGEYSLAKETIEQIPEIYFSRLSVAAQLLEGEDMFEAAVRQKSLAFGDLIEMYERLADYYEQCGESEKSRVQLEVAVRLIQAVKEDFATQYSRKLYECYEERIGEFLEKMKKYGE